MAHLATRMRRCPLALAASLALCAPAWSAITTTGDIGVGPVNLAIGPGNTLLPNTAVWVGARWAGSTGVGSLLVDNGSFLQLARLSFGAGGNGAQGSGQITGAGTTVQLLGDGASRDQVQRLLVGNFGNADLSVSGGALLDTRGNPAPCLLAFHYCDSFVGSAAGDTASLNIAGAGTQVNIGQSLFVAHPGLAVQHLDGYTHGVPGGTTRGTVNVTAGAVLSTDRAQIGTRHWSTNATGFERNFAEVNVSGVGSRWVVTGGQTVTNHATGAVGDRGASITTALDRNAWASFNISGGGRVEVQGQPDVYNFINLTNSAGRTDMLVTGAGSLLSFTGLNGVLQVGRSLGTARLSVLDGGVVEGMFYLSAGRDGSNGVLLIDGAGSTVRVNGTATAAANGSSNTGFIDIGRNGTGTVNVTGGGQLLLEANQALAGGTGMNLGRDAASSGTLNIAGAGSVVRLTSVSVLAGGGATEARNPFVSIGRDGNGALNISGGGKLLLEGGAVSTTGHRRSTSLLIGGFNDQLVGGKGVATVTGVGSEIRLSSGDSFMAVGTGPTSNGQLSVRAGGAVHGMGLVLGRNGGVGVLSADAATLAMSGQQSAGLQSGAFFVVADGGGVGVALLANGSLLSLSNPGSSGAGFTIGGSGYAAGGDGSLTLTGGSRIEVNAASGLGGATIGREGSGFLRLRGASSVDLGDGILNIGRFSGSDGTVIASESSTLTAGWVGVGARKTATGDADGGTGTFVLINSTLNAGQIVIGTNGFLGGTGTINGVVTNRGIFAPGNSPGRLEINGGFIAEAGSRLILEVESDGQGGFKTDELVFNAGQPLDLAGLKVEFRFLGATDPVAFQASGGFATATFFQVEDANGTPGELAPSAFGGVSFAASAEAYTISNFSFAAATGANAFSAVPVPEPATFAMLLAGLAGLGWRVRRRC